MADRKPLLNRSLGSAFRDRLNDNFKEKMNPDYLVGWKTAGGISASADQTIAYNTVTTMQWDDVSYNESDVYFTGTRNAVANYPFYTDVDSGSDASGVWVMTATAGWSNSTTNLDMHLRQVWIEVRVSGIWFRVGGNTRTFAPTGLRSNPPTLKQESTTLQQVYTQIILDPASTPEPQVRCRVWHNATAGGSPVSLNLNKYDFVAPLWMMARINNYQGE